MSFACMSIRTLFYLRISLPRISFFSTIPLLYVPHISFVSMSIRILRVFRFSVYPFSILSLSRMSCLCISIFRIPPRPTATLYILTQYVPPLCILPYFTPPLPYIFSMYVSPLYVLLQYPFLLYIPLRRHISFSFA